MIESWMESWLLVNFVTKMSKPPDFERVITDSLRVLVVQVKINQSSSCRGV